MIYEDENGNRYAFRDLAREKQEEIRRMVKENTPKLTQREAERAAADISFSLMDHPVVGTQTYVAWGERTAEVTGKMKCLGFDYGRAARLPRRGLRRAVYDFCFGYVSGFPVKDIIWYIFTRPLNPRKEPKYMKVWRERNELQTP